MDASLPGDVPATKPLHLKQPPEVHRAVAQLRKHETAGHVNERKRSLSPVTLAASTQGATHEQLVERNRQLAFEVERRDVKIRELTEENTSLKEAEFELSRLLDEHAALGQSHHPGKVSQFLKNCKKKLTIRSPMSTVTEIPVFLYVLFNQKKTEYITLECRDLKLDRSRVNIKQCHVTDDDLLLNTPLGKSEGGEKGGEGAGRRRHQGARRLKKYWGTCSSSKLPVPSPSFREPYPGPQYWETETTVELSEELDGRTVFEVGMVEETHRDSEWRLYGESRSWCILLTSCIHHDPGVCTQLWHHGRRIRCVEDSLLNVPGTCQTLRHGFVVDIAGGRVVFLELDSLTMLSRCDTVFEQNLYPVFGLRPTSSATVTIRLISGRDICMSEEKQHLIYKCLE